MKSAAISYTFVGAVGAQITTAPDISNVDGKQSDPQSNSCIDAADSGHPLSPLYSTCSTYLSYGGTTWRTVEDGYDGKQHPTPPPKRRYEKVMNGIVPASSMLAAESSPI
ncbi:hypothetical protein BGZ63DRAFT_428293 [Mariannaea sp. PMI_226]|nr:hypothetical protein BGZ63DRAFT_428293 [Mariannaea sp. PMI_226]